MVQEASGEYKFDMPFEFNCFECHSSIFVNRRTLFNILKLEVFSLLAGNSFTRKCKYMDLIARFAEMHRTGLFVMPNAWDAGSAKFLASYGFASIGTTSAGIAFSLGYRDSDPRISAEKILSVVESIVRAVDVPVSADLEAGLGHSLQDVAKTFKRAIDIGCAGGSIEDVCDYTHAGHFSLYSQVAAVERLKVARDTIDKARSRFVLTARTECYLTGHPNPLGETLSRLSAYFDAGADCVFAPGITDVNHISAIVSEIKCPLSVLPTGALSKLSRMELEQLGVRRLSTGSAIARLVYTTIRAAALDIHGAYPLAFSKNAITSDELDNLFNGSFTNRPIQ
ncbi:MAG: isocitrate lyase/PEP mutase family protein [Burkholderiaceae bacterium]